MSEEIAFENGRVSCITHRPLSTCRISLKSNKPFVDGHGWTYVRTDGHLKPALLGRLYGKVDLKSGERILTIGRTACHGVEDWIIVFAAYTTAEFPNALQWTRLPQTSTFPWGITTPCKTGFLVINRQIDKQTDHATPCVAIGRHR